MVAQVGPEGPAAQSKAVDFKSLVPDVTDCDIVGDQVGAALAHQYMFERKLPPWEMEFWDAKELREFSVDELDIDRVYALEANEDNDGYSGGNWYLVGRVRHKNGHLFFEMSANCDSSGFGCQGGGELYLTANANVFYNVVGCVMEEKDAILKSLTEDGYDIVPQVPVGKVDSWHNPSRLMFLCHQAIRDNQPRLAHYPKVLPRTLKDSVDEFIRTKEAMDDAAASNQLW